MKKTKLSKRKKEILEITLPEIPTTKRNPNVLDDEIYMEQLEFVEKDYSAPEYETLDELSNRVKGFFEKCDKTHFAILHKYYFFKLFSKVAWKDEKFNKQILTAEQQMNRARKLYEEYKKKYDVMKYLNDLNQVELVELFRKTNELVDFYTEVSHLMEHISKVYYLGLKMASYSIANEKKPSELEKLARKVNEFLDGYKSVQEAHDDVYYRSGELITSTITTLVECFKKNKNQNYILTYHYAYFLESEVIISFGYTEWVNLFNKIRYVMRTTNNVELFDYLNFAKLYGELEVRYLVMLIYHETLSKINTKVRGAL